MEHAKSITPEDDEQMFILRNRGVAWAVIAKKFGISKTGAINHVKKHIETRVTV